MNTIAVLDCEATGTDPETARIVSVYLGRLTAEMNVSEVVGDVINIDIEIPIEATAVHGITTAYAREHGFAPSVVMRRLADNLKYIAYQDIPLVVMNAPYDLTLIHREVQRHLGWDITATLDRLTVLDALVLDRRLYKKRSGSRRLQDLVHYYHLHLPTSAAHSADWDAYAAGLIALKQLDNDALSGVPIEDIHDAQVAWYADQASEFKKIRPNEKVNYQWPWIPPKGISE